MTLQAFEAKLKEVFPDVYPVPAPPKKTRFVTWHRYGRSPILGDDRNQVDPPKVQLDIVTNVWNDILADDIMGALWMMDLPYEVVSEGYDDDYAAHRTIIQTVVV